jgi:hypothetical protein
MEGDRPRGESWMNSAEGRNSKRTIPSARSSSRFPCILTQSVSSGCDLAEGSRAGVSRPASFRL